MRKHFESLLGNDAAKKRFSSAILSGTLPHAFLIDGPRGAGKKLFATEISAALCCENKANPSFALPCRECNTCRRIREGNYTDVKTLKKPSGKSTIGVDAVKDFKEDMYLSAVEGEFKIYIIDSAECLTPQAQNALLTVMEEPPPSVVIFLLSSSSDKILSTIKSRTQFVAMERFTRERLEEYLMQISANARALKSSDQNAFYAVLSKSDGYIGAAVELLSPESARIIQDEHGAVLKFMKALEPRTSFSELYSAVRGLPEGRGELTLALEDILKAIGDLVKAKQNRAKEGLAFYSSHEEVADAVRVFSLARLFKIYELILAAHEKLSKNAMTAAVMASLAANIKMI